MSDEDIDRLADQVLAEIGGEGSFAPTLSTPPDPVLRELRDAASLASAALLANDTVPLPTRLVAALEADALAHCSRRGGVRLQELARPRTRAPWRQFLAVAAVFVIAGAWWLFANDRALSPAAARQQLLQAKATNVQLEWKAGPDPLAGSMRGDVVWSDAQQQGYLRFAGLPPLDAARQYQLWIVDAARQGAPVDGGLFDLPAGGAETIVPVQARLPVQHAAAFVVTVEARGGVVVSKQEHVVAIAGL